MAAAGVAPLRPRVAAARPPRRRSAARRGRSPRPGALIAHHGERLERTADALAGRPQSAYAVSFSLFPEPLSPTLRRFALDNGPAYAHPRAVWFVDELPLAGTNKIDRKTLVDRAVATYARDDAKRV